MTTTEKLHDLNLPKVEEDAIIGAFVRQYENGRTRKRWIGVLKQDYGVVRPVSASRSYQVRKLPFVASLLAIAASLLLLLTFLPGLQQPSGTDLLAQQVSQITLETSRSTGDRDIDRLRRDMKNAYQQAHYGIAITAGKQLVALPEATKEDLLSLGLAQLRSEDYSGANAQFRELLADNAQVFRAEAHYYLGLSLLLQGDTEDGLSYLRQISAADGHKLYGRARALLVEIQN